MQPSSHQKYPMKASFVCSENYHRDNGFTSRKGMMSAHQPLVKALIGLERNRCARILDLGCGNGALLESLTRADPTFVPYGVEHNFSHYRHAQIVLDDYREHFFQGDMFDDSPVWSMGEKFDFVLLMPGRLLERTPLETRFLRKKIMRHAKNLVVYAYGDWLSRFGDIINLASACRLQNIRSLHNSSSVGVAIATTGRFKL